MLLDTPASLFAWLLVLAIAAGELLFVGWAGRKCLRRWRRGELSRRRISIEVFGVVGAILLIAWGAAVTP
jgi:hypothetical protein